MREAVSLPHGTWASMPKVSRPNNVGASVHPASRFGPESVLRVGVTRLHRSEQVEGRDRLSECRSCVAD